jgi:hypothetical protein
MNMYFNFGQYLIPFKSVKYIIYNPWKLTIFLPDDHQYSFEFKDGDTYGINQVEEYKKWLSVNQRASR